VLPARIATNYAARALALTMARALALTPAMAQRSDTGVHTDIR
jgi:hypothetical protein